MATATGTETGKRTVPASSAVEVVVAIRGAPPPAILRRWLSILLRHARANGRLSVLLCGDARIRTVNRTWRGQDRPTDVLSFSPEPDPPRPPRRVAAEDVLGDLVVSVPTAVRQARQRGHPAARELQILFAHGLLHLLGYDHERDDGTMFRLQARLVRDAFGAGPNGVPETSGESEERLR